MKSGGGSGVVESLAVQIDGPRRARRLALNGYGSYDSPRPGQRAHDIIWGKPKSFPAPTGPATFRTCYCRSQAMPCGFVEHM